MQVTEEIGFEVEHFQIDIHLIKNASLALLGTGFASDTRTLRMRDSRNSQFFPRLRRGNTGGGGTPSRMKGTGDVRKEAMNP